MHPDWILCAPQFHFFIGIVALVVLVLVILIYRKVRVAAETISLLWALKFPPPRKDKT